MRVETVDYNVYQYNELSSSAKEKVKAWYLDGREPYFFTEMCEEDLYNLFGENELEVQYSLGYCQGDGFNIYGKIYTESILNCLDMPLFAEFKDILTEKEKKTILHYSKECGKIELPMNNRYCYSLADYIDIKDNWEYDLKNYSNYKNINVKLLEKFEKMVKDIFEMLCSDFEKQGYDYFYEITEEELMDMCEANGYEFLIDGTLF